MKLSELTEAGKGRVLLCLAHQEHSWEHSSVWWKAGLTEAQKQMQQWNRAFIKFRDAVLADQDIDAAFEEWSGQPTRLTNYNKINVPQMSFLEWYNGAVRDVEQQEAAQ